MSAHASVKSRFFYLTFHGCVVFKNSSLEASKMRVIPLEFHDNIWCQKTRKMLLYSIPYSEKKEANVKKIVMPRPAYGIVTYLT